MTIEEAVEYYKQKKDKINNIDVIIKRIRENKYFEHFPGQFLLYSEDMEEIGNLIAEYRKRLEDDLKEEFKLD